ncbi:ANTAR domain-containing protein [Acetobacterium fimetarium]|uniref:Stage 0 sporulation protein A homolog n=1 Tax=Acetobacterium fimetarium TaxID=52691 RepID=A0ABR6WUE1_9FIRM|nr:ANTAR domain-containing protein [Acetobacterium fimetarium]MBC3804201.1 ANTAR domain-containing protein [Acetobacterium fimetarium]
MSSVLLVCKQNDVIRVLADVLRPMNFQLIDSATSAGEGRRRLQEIEYDLVIVNTPLGDEFGTDFAIDIMDKFMVGVILIVKSDSVSSVEEKMMDTAAFVVPKPFNRQLLVQNVRFVLQSRDKFQRLQKKNTELKAKIEDIGIVYRGKLFLMGYLDMTEDEAHRYIQKKAMDMRISPRKVAEQIIDTYSKKK